MNESEIFSAAVKLSAAERAEFLDLACRGNPTLRKGVDALLNAHDDSQSFLRDSSKSDPRERAEALRETLDPRTTETAGTIIAGKYKLLDKPIGEGGMGTVWLAEQREPVKRLVAIKLIRAGMDSKAVLARFEAERHALALMDHPNIARILDGGITGEDKGVRTLWGEAPEGPSRLKSPDPFVQGRPFFVMELVKGIPITEFCDARRLTPKQRLELFVPVCQAIQHAHQKGIIHRDIKPSNVLVALYDDKPVPKVIDFGLAKATGQALTEQTLNTGFNVVGTPQYMSPEQATFNQLDIDTRSDIYSLGVLLYELLAGSPPFKKQELEKAGFLEILRVIREDEPQRPSTKVSTADGLPSISANRGIEPNKLTGLLRNELDWIVMKALEKDRSRRYETANGFAADINRYLAGEAVLAHPPSQAYRLKKFLRKHKGPVLAASLIFVALLAGIIGTTLGLFQADAQRKLADGQRDRAIAAEGETRKRAGELKMVSDFQAGMLEQIDPTEAGKLLTADVNSKFAEALTKANVSESERARQTSAFAEQWKHVNATDAACELIDRTILKPAVAAIDKQFADQPTVDAQLRQVLADRYHDLGLFDSAMPLQRQALAIRRRVLGEEHQDTLISINNMGTLLQEQGKLSEAEPYCRDGLAKCRRVLGEEHSVTLSSINNMGSLLQAQGKLREAEPYLREALEKSRRELGEENTATLISICNLGMLLQAQGKPDEAEPYLREALEKSRRVMGEDDPFTLISISNLGGLLKAQDKRDEAGAYLREALDKSVRVLGDEHPSTLLSIGNLGELLQAQGKYAEAEPYLREALEKSRRILGEDHPRTLASINNLGMCLRAQGTLSEAGKYFREALDKYRRVLGDDHPDTLNSINSLATLYWSLNQLEKSIPLFEDVLKRQEAKLGREHPSTLTTVANLGVNYMGAGRLDEALPLLEEAYAASRKFPAIGWVGVNLLDGYVKAGKTAEAAELLPEQLAEARKNLPSNSPQLADSLASFGRTLLELKSYSDAESLLRECLAIREQQAPDDWRTFNCMSMLGGCLMGDKKYIDAEPILLAGYEGMNERKGKIPEPSKERIPQALDRLIDLYTDWHAVEPDKGYDGKAALWQKKLDEYNVAANAKSPESNLTEPEKQP